MSQPQPSPFIALQHRNFRLLWFGQLISFSGSMMQNAAILWQVSLLVPENQKAIALGLVGVVRVVPISPSQKLRQVSERLHAASASEPSTP